MELLILVRLRPEIQCTRGLTRTPAAEYKNRDFHKNWKHIFTRIGISTKTKNTFYQLGNCDICYEAVDGISFYFNDFDCKGELLNYFFSFFLSK